MCFIPQQTPYYWPSQNHSADTTDYAIYLTKRLSRNKQKHGLEDYELEAYNKLKKALAHKWDFITMQAEEQVRQILKQSSVSMYVKSISIRSASPMPLETLSRIIYLDLIMYPLLCNPRVVMYEF